MLFYVATQPFADSLPFSTRAGIPSWTAFWDSDGFWKKQAALPAAALLSWVISHYPGQVLWVRIALDPISAGVRQLPY